MVAEYAAALQRYEWSVESVNDLRLAPFHSLATEDAVHAEQDHGWHMERLAELGANDDVLTPTAHRIVDLADRGSGDEAIAWWEFITDAGGEGMVVKPSEFVAKKGRTLVQPAVKCRRREYLRIIDGPEYTAEENLRRLCQRELRSKGSLAQRELALGLEALARFVKQEPLRRVHKCVFAVLAMELEPVDPRL